MKNTKNKTFADLIAFQLAETGKSEITILSNLNRLKTAIIYNKEHNEISIIQECYDADVRVSFFDQSEVAGIKEILGVKE